MTIGSGGNPSFSGTDGIFPLIHFRDDSGAAPVFKMFDTNTWSVTPSPITGGMPIADLSFRPHACDSNGSVLYCAGQEVLGGFYVLNDSIRAYDFSTGIYSTASATTGTLVFASIDASGPFGAVEMTNGEVRSLSHNGGQFLYESVACNAAQTARHPVVSSSMVVCQGAVLSGGRVDRYTLEVWDRATDSRITHALGLDEPRPAQAKGGWITYDTDNSVQAAFVLGGFDPGAAPFDPTLYGCSAFRQLKYARADTRAVEGVGCPEGDSVLYVMSERLDGTYSAYFVDELDPTNPEYEVLGEYIVYVNSLGEVVWITVDVNSLSNYVYEWEPNETLENARDLPTWKRARGSLVPKTDVDLWRVELEEGTTYRIATGLPMPGALCYAPGEDTVVTLLDSYGAQLTANNWNWFVSDGYEYRNECGIIDGYTAPYTGTYYIQVSSGSLAWPIGMNDYGLSIETL